MLHDPVDYPEPYVFKPERFLKDGSLNPDVRDPNEFAFGYGRRCVVCSAFLTTHTQGFATQSMSGCGVG